LIRALPIWRGRIDIAPLAGGMTNHNYLVGDGVDRAVVRLGGDIPLHGVMRFNEHAASRAAADAGVSPAVRYTAPGVLVLDFIEGRCFTDADVRGDRDRCVALVRRAHDVLARHLRGPALAFNVFHVLRDYAHTLADPRCPHDLLVPRLSAAGEHLAEAVGPIDLVFAHNDLLASNFIDDGTRLWLIDWDYAGFNTPLFDLAGLSSNNRFTRDDDAAMLAAYYGRDPDAALGRRLRAMVCASLLRETLWSMVSELHATVDFDYAAYTRVNLEKFERAYADFQGETAQ
jgi:thiamine kinase-like enzyme